ncbi:MAG: hypothetical protein AAGF86_12350 [Pseudomonadota bacterium]
MLEIARSKGFYAELRQMTLGELVDAEVLPSAPHDPHNGRLKA